MPLARTATLVVPSLIIGLLSWPLLFTDATFNQDWLNHLWYVWHQSLAIRADYIPSLFLNYAKGIFYPIYAFYGGTLYSATGALSLAFGNAPLETYIFTYMLGFAAAYGGWYWLSRTFGLHGWLAHLPSIVFVTSASYLMLIYALGDWPEFISVSMMPLMIAAGLSVLRADRLRTRPAIAFATSCVIFSGSHLLTVIWGSTVLILTGASILLLVPEARRALTRGRVLRIAGLAAPSLLVNAWFLLPTIAYESQTAMAVSYHHFRSVLRETAHVVAAGNLFSLSRTGAPGTIVYVALPVLAMTWTLVSVALSLGARRRGMWLRVFLALGAMSALILIVMTHVGLILALPRVYGMLQFSFRLESYVLLGVSGTLLAALVLAGGNQATGWQRHWKWLLAPIAAYSLIGASAQIGRYPSGLSRSSALSSYSEPIYEQEGLLNYVDDRLPIWQGHPLPKVRFPLGPRLDARYAVTVTEPPGQLLESNIRSGPQLVDVTGAKIVGTDHEADDVLEVDRHAGRRAGPVTISVAPADTLPVVLGRLLSAVALLALALQLLWPTVRRLRAAKGSRASPSID